MKNRVIVALMIIAAIFPFAATAFELDKNLTAMAVLAALSVIAISIAATAMLIKPKRTAESDTPVQAIPTVKRAAGPTAESKPNPAPVRPNDTSAKPATASAKKPDSKGQRVR